MLYVYAMRLEGGWNDHNENDGSRFQEMKEQGEKRKRPKGGDRDDDDTEQASGVRKKVRGGSGGGKNRGGGAWRGGRWKYNTRHKMYITTTQNASPASDVKFTCFPPFIFSTDYLMRQ